MKQLLKNEENAQKIAILGLANAGKTSIIKSLTREFDMLTQLKPTQNVERNFIEFLGKELVFWDFGGQEIYRNKYLEAPERYFNDIFLLLYVVDIQDPSLLLPNVSYFRGIVNQGLKKYSPDAQVVIVFHKSDPNFVVTSETKEYKNKFLEAILPMFDEEGLDLLRYSTSIYKPMSIITALSQPLFNTPLFLEQINTILSQFGETYGLLFVEIFTKNFFELASYANPSFQPKLETKAMLEKLRTFLVEYDQQRPAEACRCDDPESPFDPMVKEFESLSLMGIKFEFHFGKELLPFHIIIGYNDESVFEQEGFEITLRKMSNNLEKIFLNLNLEEIVRQAQNRG